jgi:Protein of unknown function (DUF3192)
MLGGRMRTMKEAMDPRRTDQRPFLLVGLALAMILGGCVGTRLKSLARQNRVSMNDLTIGMSVEQVKQVMGRGTGLMNNPYRSASRATEKGVVMTVTYYFTDWSKRSKGEVPDDALTPLVFMDKKLVGWGRRFFEKEVKRLEVRKR